LKETGFCLLTANLLLLVSTAATLVLLEPVHLS
jgi:hypothetical protein